MGALAMSWGGAWAPLGGITSLVGLAVTLNGIFNAVRALDSIAAVTYNGHLRAPERS